MSKCELINYCLNTNSQIIRLKRKKTDTNARVIRKNFYSASQTLHYNKMRNNNRARHIDYNIGNVLKVNTISEKGGTKKSYNTYRNKWEDMTGSRIITKASLTDENMSKFLASIWKTKPCSPSQIKSARAMLRRELQKNGKRPLEQLQAFRYPVSALTLCLTHVFLV